MCGVRWIVVVVLAIAWVRADAASLAVGDVRAEQDVRVEADATGLLIRSALSKVTPLVVLPADTPLATAGDAAKTAGASHAVMLDLGREGTKLRLTVAVVSVDGKRDVAYVRAGDGDIRALAQGAVDTVVAAIGEHKVSVPDLSLGVVRPYAVALRARTPDDAAHALAESLPETVLPLNAAKTALADVPSKASTPELRALAARAIRDAKTLRQLGSEASPIAAASNALAELVTGYPSAAETALATKEPTTGLRVIAEIAIAETRTNDRLLADRIAAGLATDQALAALAIASSVAPKRLDAKTHKLLLAAVEKFKPMPGVASSIGVSAASMGVQVPRALALVDARELDAAQLAALEPIVAKGTDAASIRLRAEIAMRKLDGTESGAVRELVRVAPDEKRAHRYLGWILMSEGKYAEAATELATAGAVGEQVRALAAAGQYPAAIAAMGHAPASPEELVIAAHVALADKKIDVTTSQLAIAQRLAPLSPDVQQIIVKLGPQSGAVDAQRVALATQVLAADATSTIALAGSAAATSTIDVGSGSASTGIDVTSIAVNTGPIEPLVTALTALQSMHGRRLAIAEIAWEPPLFSLRITDTKPVRSALTKLLSARPYHFEIIQVTRAVPSGPVSAATLDELTTDTDGVLLYRVEPRGERAHVSVMLYVRGQPEATTAASLVDMPGVVQRDREKVTILAAIAGLIVLSGLLWLLRPKGTIKINVKRAPDIDQEVLCVSITTSPRRPLVDNPEQFHKETRKEGAITKPRFATLIASGAKFKVPTGHWYVHLYGAYLRGDRFRAVPAACTEEIKLKRGQLTELTFDLASKLAELSVEVAANPPRGVAIWANDRTDEKVFTDANGLAVLQLPLGTHVIHIDAHGKTLERSIQIASLKLQRLTINVERELRLQGGIAVDLAAGSDMVAEPEVPAVRMKTKPAAATEALPRASSPAAHAATEHLGSSGTVGETSGPRMPRAATPVPGETLLGRYRVVAELGRGAMGVVQRAWDEKLERDVAIKQMADDLRTNPEAMRLFTQEAKALAQLNHTNIVGMYDQISDASGAYMVMEFVDGKPLASIIEARGKMPWRDAVTIIDQVCAGLAYADARRVIHRDINGTDVDHRTDLYAVGCTLFELITGRPPFIDGDILYAQMNVPPPKPSSLVEGIPAQLDALVETLLAKHSDDRPGSANEVRTTIRDLFAS